MSPIRTPAFNWGLLISTLLVCAFGLVNLSSAARGASGNLALLQGLWMVAGLVLVLVLTALDYRIFEQLAYPILVVTLILLLVVLVAGREIKGSQRWIHLGFFNFQPSEVAKIAVVLAVAKYFSDEPTWHQRGYSLWQLFKPVTILYPVGAIGALILFWERLDIGGFRFVLMGICLVWAAACLLYALRTGRSRLHDLLSPVILLLLPAILILRQPDLGTTLVLVAIAGTMVLFVRVRWLSLLIVAAVLSALVTVVLVAASSESFELLEPHQKKRVLAFFYPELASRDDRWQSDQSEIAVGSGKTSGKGYKQSTQTRFRFLPEQQTDFVFSVWAEEWGFFWSLGVLAMFMFWIVQIVNAASKARDRFGALIGVGMAALIFWHTAINIGMVIGVLPVVGITLPLWSYGGSSVLSIMVGIGLLMSIAFRRHQL